MKVISVENVSKKFVLTHSGRRNLADVARSIVRCEKHEDFWALKDVSFEVKQGEAIGIIGHNGAGKSTVLKLLTRIMQPTSGRIRTRGRVSALIEIGAGFHPEMTGRENIYLNGSILGMTRAEIDKKFDDIVAFAELEQFIDTPVKRYSSGMYARLGFAVAAHVDPEILIVDEVLSVGDAAFQRKCLARMDYVANSGSTILYVSHNMSTVKQLCSRVIVLEKGHNVYDGDPIGAIEYYSRELIQAGKPFVDYSKLARMNHLPENREIEFHSVELLHKDSCVFVNEDKIDFLLKWRYFIPVKPINLRMEIRCSDDTPITTAFVENVNPHVVDNIAESVFSCNIGALVPGTYKVLLVLYDNSNFGPYYDYDAVWPAFVFTKENTQDTLFEWWNYAGWGYMKNDNLTLVS